ncbi:unnamed protein product [Orchesella dallaii]|uniref:Uncharacterized protein n=1 Tax=Orchesella dallaii TaxID=48710 RepID=A0ABP1QCR8_9HEXA
MILQIVISIPCPFLTSILIIFAAFGSTRGSHLITSFEHGNTSKLLRSFQNYPKLKPELKVYYKTLYEEATPNSKFPALRNLDEYLAPFSQCFVHVTNFQNVDFRLQSEVPILIRHQVPTKIETTVYKDEILTWVPKGINVTGGSINELWNFNCSLSNYTMDSTFNAGLCSSIQKSKFSLNSRPWNCEVVVALFPPLYAFDEHVLNPWKWRHTLRIKLFFPPVWNLNGLILTGSILYISDILHIWITEDLYEKSWEIRNIIKWREGGFNAFREGSSLVHDKFIILQAKRLKSQGIVNQKEAVIETVLIPMTCRTLANENCRSPTPKSHTVNKKFWISESKFKIFSRADRVEMYEETALNMSEFVQTEHAILKMKEQGREMASSWSDNKTSKDIAEIRGMHRAKPFVTSEVFQLIRSLVVNGLESKLKSKEFDRLHILWKNTKLFPDFEKVYKNVQDAVRNNSEPVYYRKFHAALSKWQDRHALEVLKGCKQVAVILPALSCHQIARNLTKLENLSDVFVGKEVLYNRGFKFIISGSVSDNQVRRAKRMVGSGIWDFWDQIIRHRATFTEDKSSEAQLKAPSIYGNISVVFTIIFFGMLIASTVFLIEVRTTFCQLVNGNLPVCDRDLPLWFRPRKDQTDQCYWEILEEDIFDGNGRQPFPCPTTWEFQLRIDRSDPSYFDAISSERPRWMELHPCTWEFRLCSNGKLPAPGLSSAALIGLIIPICMQSLLDAQDGWNLILTGG